MALEYSIAWVTIAAQNFEKTHNFYAQLLGKEPDRMMGPVDAPIYAEFHLKGLHIGVYRPKTEIFTSEPSRLSICLQVEDLENSIAHLSEIDHPVSGDILTSRHGREVYVLDPDGNRLILYQPYQ